MPICPIGFFKNSSNNRCEPCDVSCAVCDTSATDCVLFGACANGYFLLEDKCVKDCPEGTTKRYNTYFDECLPNDQVYSHYLMPSTDSINSPCHASCKTCIDDSDTGCIECFSGLKLTVDGTCAEDCGYGFYFDSVLLVCKACSL